MSRSKEQFMEERAKSEALPEVTETGISLNLPTLINLNKSFISRIVRNATEAVVDGKYDAVNALVMAKKGQELFGELEKQIRPIAEDHVKLAKGEVYRKFDTEIIQKESGVKYDFTACGDSEWNELNEEIEQLTAKRKAREVFLKSITKKTTLVDNETGEVKTINPPVRSGKLGLALTIK